MKFHALEEKHIWTRNAIGIRVAEQTSGQDIWVFGRHEVKMSRYWLVFQRVYGSRRSPGQLTRKKRTSQYPGILTEKAWSITHLLNRLSQPRLRKKLCGTKRVIPSGQDSAILPALVANHRGGFSFIRPAWGDRHIFFHLFLDSKTLKLVRGRRHPSYSAWQNFFVRLAWSFTRICTYIDVLKMSRKYSQGKCILQIP